MQLRLASLDGRCARIRKKPREGPFVFYIYRKGRLMGGPYLMLFPQARTKTCTS